MSHRRSPFRGGIQVPANSTNSFFYLGGWASFSLFGLERASIAAVGELNDGFGMGILEGEMAIDSLRIILVDGKKAGGSCSTSLE